MKCEICHQNEATIIIRGEINGQEQRELHLCKQCATSQGLAEMEGLVDGLGLVDLLHSISEKMAVETASGLSFGGHDSKDLSCDRCGMTLADLKEKGKLGCEQCYEAFHSVLDQALVDMHRGKRHVPRTLERAKSHCTDDGLVNLTLQLSRFRKELDDAVREERFEEAAHLRDQIADLNAKLKDLDANQQSLEDQGENT